MSGNWKIYTKKGDKGETSLIGGTRVSKSNIRIEAYGTIDELNSFVGLLRDKSCTDGIRTDLLRIQNALFLLESHIAMEPGVKVEHVPPFQISEIAFLEHQIDAMEKVLPVLTNFILPGGNECNSICHICRTITRRAERIITALNDESILPEFILEYVNRLSDYFFVLARFLSHLQNAEEHLWIPDSKNH